MGLCVYWIGLITYIKIMDIQSLDLNLLAVLDAMYDERRTTRVADRLGMSQPMVSYALAKLRQSLGDELFVRAGNGMAPTPFAETLREPIRRVIQTVYGEILRSHDFDPATTTRRFTFCLSDIGELVFLPKLLRALRDAAPFATLRSLSLSPREIETGLADGGVDLALGYFPDLQDGAIYQQGLFNHPFSVLMRRGHPLAQAPLSLNAFLAAEHAVVAQEGRSQEIFERRMVELGLSRRVVIQSPHFMSMPLLIAHSDIISTVPHAVAKAYARMSPLCWLTPPFEIPDIMLKQFWHRRMHFDPALVWLRGLVAGLFLGKDPTSDPSDPIFGVFEGPKSS